MAHKKHQEIINKISIRHENQEGEYRRTLEQSKFSNWILIENCKRPYRNPPREGGGWTVYCEIMFYYILLALIFSRDAIEVLGLCPRYRNHIFRRDSSCTCTQRHRNERICSSPCKLSLGYWTTTTKEAKKSRFSLCHQPYSQSGHVLVL